METLGRAACTNCEGPNPASVLPGAPHLRLARLCICCTARSAERLKPNWTIASCPIRLSFGTLVTVNWMDFLSDVSPANEAIVSTYPEWVVAVH